MHKLFLSKHYGLVMWCMAWLWSAGFDNDDVQWNFSGKTRADIISNSWGVSTFPNFEYAPGFDLLSFVMTTLSLPGSFA